MRFKATQCRLWRFWTAPIAVRIIAEKLLKAQKQVLALILLA